MYFWTWDTQEVLDMILWMREFNKSGKGRVEFTGFDMQTPNVAVDIVRDFVAQTDPDYSAALRRASDLAVAPFRPTPAGQNFGYATGSFAVKVAAGKRVRFGGYIKTEGVAGGYAGLWWRVDGASGVLAFANLQDRAPTGTTDWKRYELEIPVAADARNINFGALLAGEGTAWFDGLTVELDGVPYQDSTAFDFDFELSSPRGFFTGGDGYQVQLDSQVFHSGKQSLRMKRVAATPGDPKSVDPKLAASAWQEVVRRLETSRQAYREKGAAARDTEWAIQNARVVLQSMRMRANEVTRDRSMADNVKWILDRLPGAKIVLWAHNGHVAAVGSPRIRADGSRAPRDVRRPDGGFRFCLQPRLVSGHPPGEGAARLHRSAGARRQPRRDAGCNRHSAVRTRPEAGSQERSCRSLAERTPQNALHRRRVLRGFVLCVHGSRDGASVLRCLTLCGEDHGSPQEPGSGVP